MFSWRVAFPSPAEDGSINEESYQVKELGNGSRIANAERSCLFNSMEVDVVEGNDPGSVGKDSLHVGVLEIVQLKSRSY